MGYKMNIFKRKPRGYEQIDEDASSRLKAGELVSGVYLHCELIGTTCMEKPTTRLEIVNATHLVQNEFVLRGSPKKKVTFEVSVKGIRILEGHWKPLDANDNIFFYPAQQQCPINQVFFVCHDNNKPKIFGYVFKSEDSRFRCTVLKAPSKRKAEKIAQTVGGVFKLCQNMLVVPKQELPTANHTTPPQFTDTTPGGEPPKDSAAVVVGQVTVGSMVTGDCEGSDVSVPLWSTDDSMVMNQGSDLDTRVIDQVSEIPTVLCEGIAETNPAACQCTGTIHFKLELLQLQLERETRLHMETQNLLDEERRSHDATRKDFAQIQLILDGVLKVHRLKPDSVLPTLPLGGPSVVRISEVVQRDSSVDFMYKTFD